MTPATTQEDADARRVLDVIYRTLRPAESKDGFDLSSEDSRAIAARAVRGGDPGVWADALAAGSSWAELQRLTRHDRYTLQGRVRRWLADQAPATAISPHAWARFHQQPDIVVRALLRDLRNGLDPDGIREQAMALRDRLRSLVGREPGPDVHLSSDPNLTAFYAEQHPDSPDQPDSRPAV